MMISKKQNIWEFLYQNFISLESPKEVNIPYEYKDQLVSVFNKNEIPNDELISNTMIIIKDLLRDAYLQFIQSVKKQQQKIINEDFQFHTTSLPTPKYEELNPTDCSISSNNSPNRSISPLSYSELTFQQTNISGNLTSIPRSEVLTPSEDFNEWKNCGVVEEKKNSLSSNSSGSVPLINIKTTKSNSISEVSKKIAGKLKWRRLSSNSSGSG